jgi:hypothetical protein
VTQIGTAYLKVLLDTKEVQQGLDKTKSSITKWGKGLAIAGAAGAGLGIAVDFLKESVEAAKESERVQKNLERTVKTTGQSYAKYADQISDTIDKTSQLAAVDDEDLAESFTKLQGSTKDVNKALEGMQLAADIAAARGISLEAATKAVEKSMTGQANAFKRVGVNLPKVTDAYDALRAQVSALQDQTRGASKAEKEALKDRIEQVKQGYEAARAIDKQRTAAQELTEAQKRFGGAAEDFGKTSAAAQERFNIALENVKETIGTALLPLLTKFFNYAAEGLVAFQKYWPQISETIRTAVRIAQPILDYFATIIRNIAEQTANVARLIAAIARGDWRAAWQAIKDIVVEALTAPLDILKANPFVKLLGAALDQVKRMLGQAVAGVKAEASKIGNAIVDGIMAPVDLAVRLGNAILAGLRAAATFVVTNFGTPFAKVVELIVDRLSNLLDFGARLGRVILNGIKDAAQWVIDHIVNPFAGLGDKLWQAFKDGVGDLADRIRDFFSGLIPRKFPGTGISIPNPFSAIPTAAPAAVAGSGGPGGVSTMALGAPSGGGMLGSGLGVRPLSLPAVGAPTIEPAPIEVRVYIGDEELRGIVRTEVVRVDTGTARTLLAGGPV